ESEIYCSQLLRQKRGFPLYDPEPRQTLPQEYQQSGVAIGDVGRITPNGAFDFFFNIYLPADHPINDNDVPENFSPLPALQIKGSVQQILFCGRSCFDSVGSKTRSRCLPGWGFPSQLPCSTRGRPSSSTWLA
ncbi:hypothetical protein B0H14DRAFT_2454884, partial [Mycena olivaceomarginata]